MPGSRGKAFVCALAVCLSTSLVFAEDGSAPAASGVPRGLTPPPAQPDAAPATAIPETSDVPTPDQEPTEEVLPDQVGKPRGPRVTVSGLAPIDPSGAGLLDQSSGSFARTIWNGTPRSVVVTRISQLPAAPNSPAMQGLLRRILLSSTNPPQGVTPPDEPGMLAQRLNKLIAGGRVGEAATLGAQSGRDDAFARQAWAEALLLQSRDEDACGEATDMRQSSSEPFWLKLRAFCYIVGNDRDAAQLTLDVMHERAVADDAFFSLAAAVNEGAKAKVDVLPNPGGVHIALLNRSGVTPPSALAAWLPANRFFLQSTDPALKLAAIERAAVAGLTSPAELADAYNAETFTPDQYDDPDEWAPKLSTSKANALYFQSISKRTRPAARAAAFAAALERADSQNRFAIFAQVSRGLARQTPAVAETAWLTPHIIRVLLYNGDAKNVSLWLSLLTSPTDAPVVNSIRIQAAVVYPSAENVAMLEPALTWLGLNAQKPGGGKDVLMARALREIPLLDALGYTIPPEAQWAVSPPAAGATQPGLTTEALAALTRAVQQRRVGEVVLDCLVALGSAGPARAPTNVVARVVDGLATVGLRDEAGAIASEAMLGASLRPAK
ncbi:MAG: hypothetical protein ABL973_01540 [Micropepsaceae bacterium]